MKYIIRIFIIVIALINFSCHRKVFIGENVERTKFKLLGSNGKVVDGILWTEYKKRKTHKIFLTRTKQLTSVDLLKIKSQISKNVTSDKMLIREVISANHGIGLYEATIFSKNKVAISEEFKDKNIERFSSIMFPVLKFDDEIIVNTCITCKVDEKYIDEFKLKHGKSFNEENIVLISNYFMNGVTLYKGH